MEQELGYEGNFYTTMVSVYFPFYILAAPIATVLARKLGPRLFLSGITLSFGLIVIGFGLCKSWKDQVGLRAVLGLFEGCLFPSATFIISMHVSPTGVNSFADVKITGTIFEEKSPRASRFFTLLVSSLVALAVSSPTVLRRWTVLTEKVAGAGFLFGKVFSPLSLPS